VASRQLPPFMSPDSDMQISAVESRATVPLNRFFADFDDIPIHIFIKKAIQFCYMLLDSLCQLKEDV
jgi:hypothetical protein